MTKIQDFFKKHVSMTILLSALLIALTNYLVYPTFIKEQLKLRLVPVANETIAASTQVQKEDISMVNVTADLLPEGVVTETEDIVGKYVKNEMTVPAGGFFYQDALADKETVMGKNIAKLQPEETAYVLTMDAKYNQDDSLLPGQRIDLYYLAEKENGNGKYLLTGKLAEQLRILAVSADDSSKQYLTLAVKEADVAYLMIAEATGEILPFLSWQSALSESESTLYYDVAGLQSLLSESAVTVRRLILPEEEANGQ